MLLGTPWSDRSCLLSRITSTLPITANVFLPRCARNTGWMQPAEKLSWTTRHRMLFSSGRTRRGWNSLLFGCHVLRHHNWCHKNHPLSRLPKDQIRIESSRKPNQRVRHLAEPESQIWYAWNGRPVSTYDFLSISAAGAGTCDASLTTLCVQLCEITRGRRIDIQIPQG